MPAKRAASQPQDDDASSDARAPKAPRSSNNEGASDDDSVSEPETYEPCPTSLLSGPSISRLEEMGITPEMVPLVSSMVQLAGFSAPPVRMTRSGPFLRLTPLSQGHLGCCVSWIDDPATGERRLQAHPAPCQLRPPRPRNLVAKEEYPSEPLFPSLSPIYPFFTGASNSGQAANRVRLTVDPLFTDPPSPVPQESSNILPTRDSPRRYNRKATVSQCGGRLGHPLACRSPPGSAPPTCPLWKGSMRASKAGVPLRHRGDGPDNESSSDGDDDDTDPSTASNGDTHRRKDDDEDSDGVKAAATSQS